jgi:GNAT superfamily N-acetyltransferase
MLFATPVLAARIDRAEARLCASIATRTAERSPAEVSRVFEVGGGLAVFVAPGSPTNKMIGVGFDGTVQDDELDGCERYFADRGAPLQAEVATLAAPDLIPRLVDRGYRPVSFENVLGHDLGSSEARSATGVVVREAQPVEAEEVAEVMATGFANPDVGGVGGEPAPPADVIRRWARETLALTGFRAYVALVEGQLAGAAAMRLDDGVAQFSGAATLPVFRRRGAQTALLTYRLEVARRAGCDVGVIVTQPASKSQENSERRGFRLLYARQLLIKQPIG